jgi:hypothetical protein
MRFLTDKNYLFVNFPQAMKSWEFLDLNEEPMIVLAVHSLTIDGSECFAVALQSQSNDSGEIRLLCASTSVTAPEPLTILIVTFNKNLHQFPTSFASTDGSAITPILCGKTSLFVGLSNGDVYWFNLSRAFRLDVCRENSQRTGTVAEYTFGNFIQASGGIKVSLTPQTSTNISSGPVEAICFIEQGGSFGEAAIAVVRKTGSNNDTELRVVYLDPEHDRTKAHCTKLETKTNNQLYGWSIKYIHRHHNQTTLLTCVCSGMASIYSLKEYHENNWTSNSTENILSESNVRYPIQSSVYVGMAMSTGNCSLLISALTDPEKFDVKIELIQLSSNEVLFEKVMGSSSSGGSSSSSSSSGSNSGKDYGNSIMCIDSMKKGLSSLCVSCQMSYSATQLISDQVDQKNDEMVDSLLIYVPCQNNHKKESNGLDWIKIESKTRRGRSIKNLQEHGVDVINLQPSDLCGLPGLGLDKNMVELRNLIRKGNVMKHLTIHPRLNQMYKQMRLQHTNDIDAQIYDKMLDCELIPTLNSILGHVDGSVYKPIQLWTYEIILTYYTRLLQIISDDNNIGNIGNNGNVHEKKLLISEISKISSALSNILSIVDTMRERIIIEFPRKMMTDDEYDHQMEEFNDIYDITKMLVTTAKLTSWYIEFLISISKNNNGQTYSERIEGWTTERHTKRCDEAMNIFGLTKGDMMEEEDNNTSNVLLFCEELIKLVETECPGVSELLSQGHQDNHCFPPKKCNTLLKMFLLLKPGWSLDSPAKIGLALYSVLDVASGTSNSTNINDAYIEKIANDFAYSMDMDNTMRDAILGLWHIDNHHNVHRATELLLADHVISNLEDGWEYKIARALSDAWPSGTEAMFYVRSLKLKPSTIDKCSLLVRIYLQCNAWEEAFQLQRTLCDQFIGQSNHIINKLRRVLITQCCEYLLNDIDDDITNILRLPVNELEEEHLMAFYVQKAFGHGYVNVTNMGILLGKGKYIYVTFFYVKFISKLTLLFLFTCYYSTLAVSFESG